MSSSAEIGTLRPLLISLAVRPARSALFVPLIDGIPWQRLFESALATQSSLWGGSGNLPFPLSDELIEHELFWTLLDLLDPDHILLYSPANGEMELLDPEWHTSELERLRAEFGANAAAHESEWRAVMGELALSDDLGRTLVRRVAPLHIDGKPRMGTVSGFLDPPFIHANPLLFEQVHTPVLLPQPDLGDVEALLLVTEIGRFSPGAVESIKELGWAWEERRIEGVAEWISLLFSPAREVAPWPWHISELGLDWYRLGRWAGHDPVHLVVGGEVWDFVLFYALRRFTSRAYWLPESLIDDAPYRMALHNAVGGLAAWSIEPKIQVTSVSSESLRARVTKDLRRIAREGIRTNLEITQVHWTRALPKQINRLYERDNFGAVSHSTFATDGVTPPLPTPTPRAVTTSDDARLRWMTEVRVENWTPVRNWRLGEKLLEQPAYGSHDTRTTREGLAYFCPHHTWQRGLGLETQMVRPRLRPLGLFEQVDALFSARGWRCAPSDKGIYARESAKLLGGPFELARTLRNRQLWMILVHFLVRGKPGLWSATDQRLYLRLSDLKRLLRKAETAEAALAKLEAAGVMRRGLVLKCRRCRSTSWYGLRDVGERFRCSRCRLEQDPSSESWLSEAEPPWFYALDEVVFQMLKNDGDLPIFVCLDRFGSDEPHASVAGEVDVFSLAGEKSELDIVVSYGHELWIGEASKAGLGTGTRRQERLDRLREISEVLDPHGVIIATSSAFPAITRTTAEHVFPTARPLLEIRENVRLGGSGT